MTYSRDWRSYPPAFVSLIEAASLREVTIPCASERDAKRLEGKLHAFFGVLHRGVGKHPETLSIDNLSRKVQIKAVGSNLLARPRDLEPDNALILVALAQAGAPELDNISVPPEIMKLMVQTLTPNTD